MDEYLQDLMDAYFAVPDEYFNQRVIHSFDGHNATNQDIERVFLAELYHQWRSIMCENPARYEGLILHSEVGKRMLSGETIKHPDLVLHGGQIGPNRLNSNKIFVEVKMSNFDTDDIEKAFAALREPFNYDYSVCILHNKTRAAVRQAVLAHPANFQGRNLYYQNFYFLNRVDTLYNLENLLEA